MHTKCAGGLSQRSNLEASQRLYFYLKIEPEPIGNDLA